MIINYLCWSTLISMFAIVMLYPLRNHAHVARITRALSAFFVFPSLVSSIYAAMLIIRNKVMLISIAHLPILKIQFGFELSENNILIVISLNLLMSALIFALSNRNLVNYCRIASLTCFFIFIVAATPDQLVRISAFSLGTIVLSAIFFAEIFDDLLVKVLSRDFIIHRISDFIAFTVFIHLLLKFNSFITNEINEESNHIEFSHSFFFFTSLALRILSLCTTDKITGPTVTSFAKLMLFYRLFIATGSQLLFLFYRASEYQEEKQLKFFLAILFALLIFALWNAFVNSDYPFSINNLVNLLLIGNLFLISIGYKFLATGIICALIIFYPTTSFAFLRSKEKSATKTARMQQILQKSLGFFRIPLTKTAVVLSTMFINLINIVYGGFILFRLPQFLLVALQIPLRFLNNGSIERSLLFIVLMLLGYAYWWAEI